MTSAVELERLSIPVADLNLVADAAGPTDAPVILFLHGGGQTRQSWSGALREAVRRGYRAVSLDLRGHGESDWSADGHYSLDRFTADVRQVIEYVGEKYGKTSVGQIATFQNLKARSVIKDVARAMGIPPPDAQRIASLVPEKGQGKMCTIDEALEIEPKLKERANSDPQVKVLLDQARKLEGLTRHAGMHAAGVVISEGPLDTHVPCFARGVQGKIELRPSLSGSPLLLIEEAEVAAMVSLPAPVAHLVCDGQGVLVVGLGLLQFAELVFQTSQIPEQSAFCAAIACHPDQSQRLLVVASGLREAGLMTHQSAEHIQGFRLDGSIAGGFGQCARLCQAGERAVEISI